MCRLTACNAAAADECPRLPLPDMRVWPVTYTWVDIVMCVCVCACACVYVCVCVCVCVCQREVMGSTLGKHFAPP